MIKQISTINHNRGICAIGIKELFGSLEINQYHIQQYCAYETMIGFCTSSLLQNKLPTGKLTLTDNKKFTAKKGSA